MLKSRFFSALGVGLIFAALSSSPLQADDTTYDPGKKRDPFVPLTSEEGVAAQATSSGFKLEGVIYDPSGRSMAILNGKTYEAGETIGDAKIIKIQKDHVVILVADEEKTLWIRSEPKDL